MKRILLILLSLFLLLSLFGCAKEPLSYPFVSLTAEEHSSLLNAIENPTEIISVNKAKGGVKIADAYLTSNKQSLGSLDLESAAKGLLEYTSSSVFIFNETAFYPYADGEYVYLFFSILRSNPDLLITSCISAELSEDTLSIRLLNQPHTNIELPDGAENYCFVFKIEKSSLSGNIEKLEINIVDSN